MFILLLVLIPISLEVYIPLTTPSYANVIAITSMMSAFGFAYVAVHSFINTSKDQNYLFHFLRWSVIFTLLSFILDALVLSPFFFITKNLYLDIAIGLLHVYLLEYLITSKYPTFRLLGILCSTVLAIVWGFFHPEAWMMVSWIGIIYITYSNDLLFSLLATLFFILIGGNFVWLILIIPFILFFKRTSLSPKITTRSMACYPCLIWLTHIIATYI